MDIRIFDPVNEKLYSPSQWCNERCKPENAVNEHVKTCKEESQKVRSKYSYVADLKYGLRRQQVLDLFEPVENHQKPNAPTFVFIHGGYWQDLNKEISCYCVAPLVEAGIRVIIPDYDLSPDVSLHVIVQEIQELIMYLKETGAKESWGPLWVGGHSAGAHLAASLLHTKLYEYLGGMVLISGVYNLEPLIDTSINVALNLNKNEAEKLSPAYQLSRQAKNPIPKPILMAVGEYESPAFREQQNFFLEKLKRKGQRVSAQVVSKMDHFTIVEQLRDPSYSMTMKIVNMISNRTFRLDEFSSTQIN